MDPNTCEMLLNEAHKARSYAYCPYSHFAVGAAVLCSDGSVFTGCNIENAAYSPGNCAERTAVFKAVSEGKRRFLAIAIAGGREDTSAETPCWPCGVCRQVLREFDDGNLVIVTGNGAGGLTAKTLRELLPMSFSADDLKSTKAANDNPCKKER